MYTNNRIVERKKYLRNNCSKLRIRVGLWINVC